MYICHYFSYQVTFGWCAPINARESSNWLSDIKQCKRYKEPDLYCTLGLQGNISYLFSLIENLVFVNLMDLSKVYDKNIYLFTIANIFSLFKSFSKKKIPN